ncbi:metallophosphoesterase family protein [Flavobacteriaceae bacterium F08102]|nr:metallophosphoesterase family protein [Flavobacteriaceae bacterium F08102]
MKITPQLLRLSFLVFLQLSFVHAQNKQKKYQAPVSVPNWNQPTLQPDRIVLNITEDPSTSMSVAWRTSSEAKTTYAEIAVATAAPKFWRTAKTIKAQTETLDLTHVEGAEVIANYHSVTFRDLMPNTLYGYRVGDGDHWSEWIQFKTATKTRDPFSFLYVGDAQNYVLELWSRLIRQGYKSNPNASFIIHAGDLINNANNDSQWNEWFEAGSFIHSMVPTFPIPGNHEYAALKKGEDRQLSLFWKPQFNLPLNGPEYLKETVYYTDYQGVRFIGLDTNAPLTEQAEWLINVLEKNPNQWTVVTFHHPLFSASMGRDNKTRREILKPIFDKYQVDLVLQGHDHSYARGRVAPLEYNLTSGINKLDQTGTVYVVSVSGGKMYSLRPNAWEDWEADRERAGENTQLIQSISIDGNRLHYKSLTATGALYDAFELIKNEQGPNTFIELRGDAIGERSHTNTIPYNDVLPLNLKEIVMKKFKKHDISSTTLIEKGENILYSLKLYDATGEKKYITIDTKGTITEQK